jgi:hypothetical protein
MTINHNNDNNDVVVSDYTNYSREYLHNKKKQVNLVKYTVEFADGLFAGFKRIIEMDIGIFDCILNTNETFKILNNYICNHMYFKLLFFLSQEKLSAQICELNNIKNKMSIDESLCNSDDDGKNEIINIKKLLIYIKNY